jgi:diaminopimelate epimerase
MAYVEFYKYHGAGNDFILIDNRSGSLTLTTETIAQWCHRNYGVGADGLMLLEAPKVEGDHFYMQYFNSDGRESTMCGNGGRCISRFAVDLGIAAEGTLNFHAIDGPHTAVVAPSSVALSMIDAPAVVARNNGFFIDTGSPHHVEHREPGPNFVNTASRIRASYGPEGANVNFIQACEGELSIRTYERGVENETLACGTGATAAAMVAVAQGWVPAAPVRLYAQGGILTVDFKGSGPFTDVVLTGPATQVFKGLLPL